MKLTMTTTTRTNVDDTTLLVSLGHQCLGTGIVGGIETHLSCCRGILAAGIWGGGEEGWQATTMTTMTTRGGHNKPGLGEDGMRLTWRARQATTATSPLQLSLLCY
jgi:hypothetical protein